MSADDEITLPLPTHPELDRGLMGRRTCLRGARLEGECEVPALRYRVPYGTREQQVLLCVRLDMRLLWALP